MEVIVLAATHDRGRNRVGAMVPRPLLDLGDKPLLTTLVERFSTLCGPASIHVVTNEAVKSDFQMWVKGLPAHLQGVDVVSDETESPEEARGAMGDLIFCVKKRHIRDDLLVLGGDNWFTYDIAEFVKRTRGHSPALVLTHCQPGLNTSRFGMGRIDPTGKIIEFVEKPSSTSMDLKASCVYFLSSEDLRWLHMFAQEPSTKCVPGAFIEWLLRRTTVYGVVMEAVWYDFGGLEYRSVEGPDFLSIRTVVRDVLQIPFGASWERDAAKRLAWLTSYEDLLRALHSAHANERILGTRILGSIGDLLSRAGRQEAVVSLCHLLNDAASNEYEYGGAQDDEDTPVYVCTTAAEALVRLGYADSLSTVYTKAREGGFEVGKVGRD